MEIKCPECGFARQVPEDKIPPSAKTATCPKCGQKFFFRHDPEQEFQDQGDDWQDRVQSEEGDSSGTSEQPTEDDIWAQLESLSDDGNADEHEGKEKEDNGQKKRRQGQFQGGVPWERLSEYGFFPALIETIKLVMFQPQAFFARMSLGQGYNKPLIFYLLVAEIQALAQFMWRMAGVAPQMGQQGGDFLGFGLVGLSSLLVLILYPVFLAGMLFVVSALNHACLMAVKAGEAGYEGTFKVISYSNAPMVLAVLPLFGPLIGMVWTMVCTFLGFKYVHRTTNMRVLLAMLLPLLVVLVLSMLLVSARGVG